MQKQIILSPQELYYLGRFLQAKYIDYAYVAAMDDIGQSYALFENETKAALVANGILMEDFSGNVEIDESISNLLKPIFFGEVETSLDICTLGEKNTVAVYKFHFYDGTITMVTGDRDSGKLLIKSTDQIEIQNMIASLLPDSYEMNPEIIAKIDENAVTRFIVAKSILVGRTSIVKTFIEADSMMLHEEEGVIKSITRNFFVTEVYNVVKGE